MALRPAYALLGGKPHGVAVIREIVTRHAASLLRRTHSQRATSRRTGDLICVAQMLIARKLPSVQIGGTGGSSNNEVANTRLTPRPAAATLAAVTGTPEHVLRNRSMWDQWAEEYVEPGVRNWSAAEPVWGIWGIPEAEAGVLPADLAGRDCVELGCGTGYVSAWLARRGARRPASTTPPRSWRPPATCRTGSGCGSRWFTPAPSRRRSPTQRSTWRSPSTAPASGATRTPGSRKRPGCCARAAS